MLFKKILKNCKKPEGLLGKILLSSMNKGHSALSNWSFSICPSVDGEKVLDVGCGGGANLLRILKSCPNSLVSGIDYSKVSVSSSINATKKYSDRCNILHGNVMQLPYKNDEFDRVLSFESIYFWPDVSKSLSEILRVLKKDGRFILTVEMNDPEKGKMYTNNCEGMTIYSEQELVTLFKQAGFSTINVFNKNHFWSLLEGVKK